MTFEMAGNYLNSKINGQNIDELRTKINLDIKKRKNEIDALAAGLINKGLAIWANDHSDSSLIIHGHDKLLDDVQAIEDLEKIKSLFSTLGNQELSIQLLEGKRCVETFTFELSAIPIKTVPGIISSICWCPAIPVVAIP